MRRIDVDKILCNIELKNEYEPEEEYDKMTILMASFWKHLQTQFTTFEKTDE